jgi:murein L,D-transpeptidase YcbB/YkuD
MERKMLAVAAVVIAVVFAVSGCSTVPKKYKEDMSGIKAKVDTLESRVETVESKQLEVERTAAQQGQSIEEMKAAKQLAVSKSNISILNRTPSMGNIRDIQTALKNAGFYEGKVDGIKGSETKKAIRLFQKSNGLREDGVVGPKTWELLSRYVSAPAEAPAGTGGASESIK